MQHLVAVVLTAVAAALLLGSAAVLHGLASAYGAGVVSDVPSWAVLVLVPAALALLCLVGARDPVGPPRPRTSVLAVGVLVVFCVTGAAATAHGGSVHERERAVEATACSPGDQALLRAVDAPGVRSEPAGDADGGCSMLVSWVPDADLATARVAAGLEGGGWRLTGREGDEQLWRLGEAVLRVSASSDGKATDVRLTLPPAAP